MDPITQQLALASAGAGGADPLYVDDVFSIDLYDGTGSARSITNGIDLAGEGGMIWHKARGTYQGGSQNHAIHDTERGTYKHLKPNSTDAAWVASYGVSAYNNNGYSLNTAFDGQWNGMHLGVPTEYVSWTFRKAPGFFDVVTYTGDSNSSRTISHNLGSTPGAIFIKQAAGGTNNWYVYHRSTGTSQALSLNTDDVAVTRTDRVTAVSSSTFTLGNSSEVNYLNSTYVAYLFAHDDQRFGTDENESIVKCGVYNSVYQTDVNVNLGFEPQWLLIKNVDAGNHDWFLYDPMRGLTHDYDGGNTAKRLIANGSANEANSSGIELNSTGFKLQGTNPSGLNTWGSGVANRYIYIAIRRSHKPPETATDVFDVNSTYEVRNTSSAWTSSSGFPTDAIWMKSFSNNFSWEADTRLSQVSAKFDSTNSEQYTYFGWDTQDGVKAGSQNYYSSPASYVDYLFKRAPGFFDVACWDGTGSAHAVTHNLGAVPELIICKRRAGGTGWWYTYAAPIGNTKAVALNGNSGGYSGAGFWNNTSPTLTQFTVNTNSHLNASGSKYLAYLFSSVSGISKIGSYTGTGSTNINIDCGFTNGARFVFVKRYGSSGDWYVWDTSSGRGIGSGVEPYLKFNSNASQDGGYNYIDPSSAGFQVRNTSNNLININGATYFYFAIA